jgi:hypothetical protein
VKARTGVFDSRHAPTVAIIDLLPGQHRLLTATLRSLGCEVSLIDCSGHWPASLDEQLAAQGPFDVVFWDMSAGVPAHPWAEALAGGAGSFGKSGIVIATSQEHPMPQPRQDPDERTQMLLMPFTPVTLMAAVNAAVPWGRS